MRKMILLFMLVLFVSTAHADREKVFTVGVRAYNGIQEAYQMWSPTLSYMEQKQNKYSFYLMPVFGFEQMRKLMETGQLDFVITQPAEAVILKEKYNGKIMLTELKEFNGKTVSYFSAAVFTRADRADINSFKDAKGKVFAGIDPEGFGAYWMGLKEIRDAGLKENKDFKVVFTGTQDKVVDYVLSGKADMGSVRSGILENMAKKGKINLDDVKVINSVSDGLPLLHSTKLFPEWAFIAGKNVNEEVITDIQNMLTNIPSDSPILKDSNYAGWIMPVSYISVYELMRTMHIGLYEKKSLFGFSSWPFYLKVLIPIAAIWVLILAYVGYSVYRK